MKTGCIRDTKALAVVNDRLSVGVSVAPLNSVVVVGAGMSGLAAAYRLQQRGVAVTVLESEQRPGGRVATERHGRYLVDTGPDALASSYQSYLKLVDDIGLAFARGVKVDLGRG
jgi:monoamine oxidase